MQEIYREKAVPALKKELGLANDLAVPRISKVVLNVGLGSGLKDSDFAEAVSQTLATITGQRPVMTKARVSISNFRIRQGLVIGAKVTLRGPRMYDFLDKLVHFTLPRVRDFRGLSPDSFDGHGNYSIGIKEQVVFPEISGDQGGRIHGLEIAVHTTAEDDEQGRLLLASLGFPLRKPEDSKR